MCSSDLVSECLFYCPDPSNPAQLVELTAPSNSSTLTFDPATLNTLNSPGIHSLLNSMGVTVNQEGLMVPRGADRDARDSGQWGLALRWLGDDVEYGAYAMNYHSRTPIVSMQNAGRADLLPRELTNDQLNFPRSLLFAQHDHGEAMRYALRISRHFIGETIKNFVQQTVFRYFSCKRV